MPRSSRHKSYRSHKHASKDAEVYSDSEDDRSSRDPKLRSDEAGYGSGTRVSRDVEFEKRKSSSSLQVSLDKYKGGSENGDSSGRKRKEREERSASPDRWNGTGKDDGQLEKGSKGMRIGYVDREKSSKVRPMIAESKSRSSRMREGSAEGYVDNGSRSESVKRRSEKEHTGRDYRDDKEKDIGRISEREKERERLSERDKKIHDSGHGKSDDVESRSQRSRRTDIKVEVKSKKDSAESRARDDLHNAELDDSEKSITKRRCSSGGIDKGLDDGRHSDERRLSSRDDHNKSGSHKAEGRKDERQKDDGYKDKYYNDIGKDQRHHEIRHREERSSRDYNNDRHESKPVRERDKTFESYQRNRHRGSDREFSPNADDRTIKLTSNRVQKRPYEEIEDHNGLRKSSCKESHSNADKDASNSRKHDYRHHSKAELSSTNTFSGSSLSPKIPDSKDQIRAHNEDRDRISAAHERVSEQHSFERAQHRDRINSDERERNVASENTSVDNKSQIDPQYNGHSSASPSISRRTSHLLSSSPGKPIPQPPTRHTLNKSTAHEDEMRITSGDRRSNGRYRRSSDPNVERGPGMVWKNGPNWPAPLLNGFMPFQRGPTASNFTMPHFPSPSLFGPRPYVDMNHAGIPYHMHDVSSRFPPQGHLFGWHLPIDESCPPQIYARPDWNQNAPLIAGRKHPSLNVEANCSIPQLNDPPENNNKSLEARLEAKLKSISGKEYSNGNSLNPRTYLSRIEISEDLVYPELYKQIQDLLASAEPTGASLNEAAEGTTNKTKCYGKFSTLKDSLLPTASFNAFQSAMSVYEKQRTERHCGRTAVSCSNSFPEEALTANSSFSSSSAMDVETEKPVTNNSGSRRDSHLNSQACEEAVSCRLNLIRIHTSPENTH